MRTRLQPAAAALLLLAIASGCGAAPKPPGRTFQVKIIGFNDYHGHLESPGTFGEHTGVPATQRPPVGGAEYLAAYVAGMKARNPLNVIVGAGDSIGATPLVSALFFDEPAVETLNHIGIEFNAVGNHEFDKGVAELLRLQHGGCKLTEGRTEPNSCRGIGSRAAGSFDGAAFQWLSANVVDHATGEPLLPAYGIKRFNGVPIAFIGVTLQATPGIVSPAGIADLAFLDEADTVNALVQRLRATGIEAFVVLVHQGGQQRGDPLAGINGCAGDLRLADGSDGELGRIVRRLDDAVDLVISGHTHAAYNCSARTVDITGSAAAPVARPRPTGLPNSAGRRVPVTSAGAYGRVLTDIDVTLDPRRRDIVAVSPRNVLVDRTDARATAEVAAHPAVRDIVERYRALAAPLAQQGIGRLAQPLSNRADAAGEMPAGRLIADAQLAATQPAAAGGAVVALVNPGGVRGQGFDPAGATYPATVTYGDAFTVQPFGNTLVTLDLTARQLKDLLEQQFAGCLGQRQQRILQVSRGLQYTWKAGNEACHKVVDLRLTRTDLAATPPRPVDTEEILVRDGVLQQPDRVYRVTVNDYLHAGGDGFTVLAGGTRVLGGGQDLDALVAYLRRQGEAAAPAGPEPPRIRRLP